LSVQLLGTWISFDRTPAVIGAVAGLGLLREDRGAISRQVLHTRYLSRIPNQDPRLSKGTS
jgi:hypothetical protein